MTIAIVAANRISRSSSGAPSEKMPLSDDV
jgi:hypothetical protein